MRNNLAFVLFNGFKIYNGYITNMEEIWKTIPISANYEASSHGRIRKRETGFIMKSHEDLMGYQQVNIKGTHDETITRLVHRLVAMTFIPNPENKPTVNHMGHDRSSNHISNLEWSTYKEQAQHSRKRKLTIEEHPSKCKWGHRHVWKCDKETGAKLEMFSTVREAAFSVPPRNGSISMINTVAEGHEISQSVPSARNCITTAIGFKWEFDNLRSISSEEWGEIDPIEANGREGYQISTLGRLYTPSGEVRSPHGPLYSMHCISRKELRAHRLVAITFLPRVDGKKYVNHIDGDKNNPVLSNLEWTSHKENATHAHVNGLLKPNSRRVWQYSLDGTFIREFESISSANRKYGTIDINRSIKRSSPAGGFIWKYPTDDKDRVVKLRERSYRRKKIKQFSMEGVFLKEYESLKEAKEAVPGLNNNAPFVGSSLGYRWKYETDTSAFTEKTRPHRKINQYDSNMNLVEQHKSIVAARIKVPGASVYWSSKYSKLSRGFYWKYE